MRTRNYLILFNRCQLEFTMLENITLSADKNLIKLAQKKAAKENSTLNTQFCDWLKQYVSSEHKLIDYDSLMDQLAYAQPGKKFSRDEMNER